MEPTWLLLPAHSQAALAEGVVRSGSLLIKLRHQAAWLPVRASLGFGIGSRFVLVDTCLLCLSNHCLKGQTMGGQMGRLSEVAVRHYREQGHVSYRPKPEILNPQTLESF